MKGKLILELLGRPERRVDLSGAEWLEGKRVLITGAGGTIATELARQVAKMKPAHLTLLNHSELALYSLSSLRLGVPFSTELVDVRDRQHVMRVFLDRDPDLVFHAAAAKHVPLCEEHPDAAVTTNVGGTINVAHAAYACGADLVSISTDKAVRPTSVMGMTKRVAELYLSLCYPAFRVVRFGNVLGSSGSVLPAFKKQLRRGSVISVTDPDVTRFFMTIREAARLTLAASFLPGQLFVLDMGEPVKIVDLARRFAELHTTDYRIEFTGLRPGEKMYEELFYPEESPRATKVPGVMVGRCRHVGTFPVDALLDSARRGDTGDTLRILKGMAR